MIACRLAAPLALLVASLALAACDQSGGEAPGAVSEGEAKALEEAAEMLDEQRLPDGVLPTAELPPKSGPESAPTAEMTGDSAE